jgi:hypothetical protein
MTRGGRIVAPGFPSAAGRPIAHLLFTGISFKEMFRESEILIDALLALIAQGVVALFIHDALVVPSGKVSIARKVVLEVFQGVDGVEGRVSIKSE